MEELIIMKDKIKNYDIYIIFIIDIEIIDYN